MNAKQKLTIVNLPPDIGEKLDAMARESGLDRRAVGLLAIRFGIGHLETNGVVPAATPECVALATAQRIAESAQ